MSAILGWRIDRGAAWRGALLAAMVLAPAGAAAAQAATDAPTADEVQKAASELERLVRDELSLQ